MTTLPPEYWQAVAQGIDAEDQKAGLVIKHNQSIGAARESILRDLLRRQTPEPYRVRTGFVHQFLPDAHYCSKQCDVLVYDPTVAQPDYQIDDLIVVPRDAAKAVVEVKTTLEHREFRDIQEVWADVWWIPVATFGFAFDGVAFQTFINYLQESMRSDPAGLPQCIAVHRQNYVFVRSGYSLAEDKPSWHRPAKYQFAVDFGAHPETRGLATAYLLDWYLRCLRGNDDAVSVERWFSQLSLPAGSRVRFSTVGDIVNDSASQP